MSEILFVLRPVSIVLVYYFLGGYACLSVPPLFYVWDYWMDFIEIWYFVVCTRSWWV